MAKRITALTLAFSFVICFCPAVTRADGVNLVWNCADKPIKVGSVVQISLSADSEQDFRVMVVTPDSKQTFINGKNVTFTVTKEGTHALIGYTIDPLTGQMTGMSVQQRFEAEGQINMMNVDFPMTGDEIENCQHELGYRNEHHVDDTPIHFNINEQYFHMVERKSYTVAECVICGTPKQTNYSYSRQRVAHDFDENGICTLCGYVSFMGVFNVNERYSLYIPSSYYGDDMVYIGVDSPVTVMLFDRFENKHIRAANAGADVKLSLHDPNGIATLQNDVLVATNSGAFNLSASYLGETFAATDVGVTVLSVKDKLFEYNIMSSGVVRLEDLEGVTWDDANALLTDAVSIGEFNSTRNMSGSWNVNFNAYNSSAVVVGIAVFDENGQQISTTQTIKPYWGTTKMIKSAANTFKATCRIWDSKSFNGVETQATSISVDVPSGGYIRIVQMNEDSDVFVANVAEMFLGTIKIYSDSEKLVNPTSLKTAQELMEKLGKDEFYEIIKNCLIRNGLISSQFGDFAYTLGEEAVKSLDINDILEGLAANSQDIISDVIKKLPDAVTSALLNKAEDAFVLGVTGAFAPVAYYIKYGGQSLLDTASMYQLFDAYDKCMNCKSNEQYISYIIIPQENSMDSRIHVGDVLPVIKRYVTTLQSSNLRGVTSQKYDAYITVPSNTRLELISSRTGDDGALYYEVIFDGNKGYIPADEASVE